VLEVGRHRIRARTVVAPLVAVLLALGLDPAASGADGDGGTGTDDDDGDRRRSDRRDDDDDEGGDDHQPESLEGYDDLAPNVVWPDAIGLGEVPPAVDGSGVTVAVLDTGVTRVPELGDRVLARVDLMPEGDAHDRHRRRRRRPHRRNLAWRRSRG
jgi:hypothetical protein